MWTLLLVPTAEHHLLGCAPVSLISEYKQCPPGPLSASTLCPCAQPQQQNPKGLVVEVYIHSVAPCSSSLPIVHASWLTTSQVRHKASPSPSRRCSSCAHFKFYTRHPVVLVASQSLAYGADPGSGDFIILAFSVFSPKGQGNNQE